MHYDQSPYGKLQRSYAIGLKTKDPPR